MSIFGHQYGVESSGRIFLDGKEVMFPTVSSAVEQGVAYATEDRKAYCLNLLQNIRENTSMANFRHLSRGGVIDCVKERKTAEKFLREFKTKAPSIETPTGNLSECNQQKASSPNGCPPTRRSSSSTSPPAASTSAPNTRSTRSSTSWPIPARACS